MEIDIEEIRKMKTESEERGEMMIVKLKSEESKKKVLENKSKLTGKKMWIEKDQTFKKRKIK